jgi:hypothetical protein
MDGSEFVRFCSLSYQGVSGNTIVDAMFAKYCVDNAAAVAAAVVAANAQKCASLFNGMLLNSSVNFLTCIWQTLVLASRCIVCLSRRGECSEMHFAVQRYVTAFFSFIRGIVLFFMYFE